MRFLIAICVLFWCYCVLTTPYNPPTPGPTPEQAAIADLRAEVAGLRASTKAMIESLPKPEPMKQLAFDQAYPAEAAKLIGCDNAVTKLVEKDVKNDNRFSKLESDVATLKDAPKSCPVEVNKEAPRYTIELPTSEYNVAIAAGQATNRKVLFILSQNNCVFCDQLHDAVISQPQFQEAVSPKYVISEINISQDPASAAHFQVRRTPAVLIYDPAKRTWQAMNPIPRNMPAFLAMLKGMG